MVNKAIIIRTMSGLIYIVKGNEEKRDEKYTKFFGGKISDVWRGRGTSQTTTHHISTKRLFRFTSSEIDALHR